MGRYNHYIYHGFVLDSFDHLIEERWYGETSASTKEKAISNLKYQYKKECNLPIGARLYLDPARLTEKAPVQIKLKEDILEDEEGPCPSYTQLTFF